MIVSNRQLFKNFLSNVLSLVVALGSGLLLPSIVVNVLGTSAYGVFQITLSVTVYLSLFLHSINEVLVKDLSVALAQGDVKKRNQFLTTALCILLIVSGIVLLGGALFSWQVNNIFSIPNNLTKDTPFLFFASVLSFILIMFTNYFMSIAYAKNRLDLCQWLILGRNILRFGFISFAVFVWSSLYEVGLGLILSALLITIIAIWYFFKTLPDVQFSITLFNSNFAKRILKFSSWVIVNQLGVAIITYFDVILVNLTLGSEMAGEYALLLQWRMVIYTLLGTVIQLYYPSFLQMHGAGENENMRKTFFMGIRIIGSLGAFITAIICLSTESILYFWVGNDFLHLSDIFRVVIIHWFVFATFVLFTSIFLIHEKIKIVALSTILSGLTYLLLVVFLTKYFDFGLWTFAWSSLAVLSVRNLIVYPLITKIYLKWSLINSYRMILKSILPFFIVTLVGFSLRSYFDLFELIPFLVFVILVSIISLILIWFILISKEEQSYILSQVHRGLNKIRA